MTDMSSSASSFASFTVPQLKSFLKDRGVTFTGYQRAQLVELCNCAQRLSLPVNPDLAVTESHTLAANGGTIDPFTLTFTVTNTMPNIGLIDVFNYLIMTRPEYDQRKLKAYKSWQDYRLFADGHVSSLGYATADPNTGVFNAKVRPTQRTTKSDYNLWIAVDIQNEQITKAYCQCPGGADGACRHVSAALYAIEDHDRKSVTDGPAQWVKRPRSHDEPVPIEQLKIQKISYGQDIKTEINVEFDPRIEPDRLHPTDEKITEFALRLKQINPDASALEFLLPKDEQCEVNDKIVNDECLKMSFYNRFLENKDDEIVSHLPEEIELIETETRGQSNNSTWLQFRRGMVTTSKFKRVYKRCQSYKKNSDVDCFNIAKDLLDASETPCVKSLEWGQKKEKKAREMYGQIEKKRHKNLTIEQKGLLVDSSCPYMGTSVDGMVKCGCHDTKLVEIKCPWALKDLDPKSAAKQRGCCIEDGQWLLKRESDYYYQIQGQLGICGIKECDLVIYTNKGIHVIRVLYDETFYMDMVSDIKLLYIQKILPKMRNLIHNEQ